MMNRHDLISLAMFDDTTDDELDWLLANSYEVKLPPGDYFCRENERSSQFYLVLDGELQVTKLIDGQEMIMGTSPRGIIGGELALLNSIPSPVSVCAIMPTRLMILDLPAFRALFGTCPTVGARILRIAAERTIGFASILKQQEKMAALGKLSAGLAHELNNPASAAGRAANALRAAQAELQIQTFQLSAAGLSQSQLARLQAFQQQAIDRSSEPQSLTPLEQSDREEELGDWLEAQGLSHPWQVATTLVKARVTPQELTRLTASLPAGSTVAILNWLCHSLVAAFMLDDIERSTAHISQLVGAIKQYTYMDQAPLQQVDLHQGLDNTLKVLNHKLKGVHLIREFEPNLPSILARGGELNQVWTNLIDNAVDALAGSGEIRLITRTENRFVMVEVADNGPGIPPEIQPRLFEPFFTTKDVGIGNGLGLDITYRIIQQHSGTIEVRSQPGQTRFIVRLPIGAATK